MQSMRIEFGGSAMVLQRAADSGGHLDQQFSLLKPDRPFALQVELTSSCNLRCSMCPLTEGLTLSSVMPGAMAEATWHKVLDAARTVGFVIVAGYGEPLASRRCMELLQALNDAGVLFALSTNGVAVSAKVAQQLAALPRLASVNVSIESPDPVIYQAIRSGPLEKALAGLRLLVQAMPGEGRGSASSVLMEENAATLADFPPLLASIGVRTYTR